MFKDFFEQFDGERAMLRYVPIRHDVMHILLAVFNLVELHRRSNVSVDEAVEYARILKMALNSASPGEWERFVERVYAEHERVCEPADMPTEAERVVQLNINFKRMQLLLCYDALSTAVAQQMVIGVMLAKEQLHEVAKDNIEEMQALQGELHRLAQAAWPDKLELKLF